MVITSSFRTSESYLYHKTTIKSYFVLNVIIVAKFYKIECWRIKSAAE